MRNFIRSEAFEGRDVQKKIDDSRNNNNVAKIAGREKLKKEARERKLETAMQPAKNDKAFKTHLELAHRKAFIEYYLHGRAHRLVSM